MWITLEKSFVWPQDLQNLLRLVKTALTLPSPLSSLEKRRLSRRSKHQSRRTMYLLRREVGVEGEVVNNDFFDRFLFFKNNFLKLFSEFFVLLFLHFRPRS